MPKYTTGFTLADQVAVAFRGTNSDRLSRVRAMLSADAADACMLADLERLRLVDSRTPAARMRNYPAHYGQTHAFALGV
jgi:hypothetical protein